MLTLRKNLKKLIASALFILISANQSLGSDRTIPTTDMEKFRETGNNHVGGLNRTIPQADLDKLRSTGQHEYFSEQISIPRGLFELGDIDHFHAEYWVLFDSYANDPDKILALVFPKDASWNFKSDGWLYQGRLIKGGTSLMLSPVVIDFSGNLEILSESSRNAPVLEVTLRPTEKWYHFPYIVEGRNGAIPNRVMGMQASVWTHPTLNSWPSTGIFAAQYDESEKVLVKGDTIGLFRGGLDDNHYQMIPVNGEEGKIAALVRSHLDTMAESEISGEKISKLAVFIKGICDDEVLLVLETAEREGMYHVHSYQMAHRKLIDVIFPGALKN